MTIKEQIQKKIDGYKEDFYKECGFNIIVIPQIAIDKVPIYEIVRICAEYLELSIDLIDTNTPKAVKLKEFVTGLCLKMDYDEREIYKVLSVDRTTLYKMIKRFNYSLEYSTPYNANFFGFYETLYNKIKDSPDLGKIEQTTDTIKTLFFNTPKSISLEGGEKNKQGHKVVGFLEKQVKVKGRDLIDYMVNEKMYSSRNSASTFLGTLKRAGTIDKVNGYWVVK